MMDTGASPLNRQHAKQLRHTRMLWNKIITAMAPSAAIVPIDMEVCNPPKGRDPMLLLSPAIVVLSPPVADMRDPEAEAAPESAVDRAPTTVAMVVCVQVPLGPAGGAGQAG